MNNETLLQRSLAAVWHPCTQMRQHEGGPGERLPLVPVVRASGAWLYDADGRRYLDAISSWWVNLFGHAHPRINAAIAEQLQTLEHVMLAGFTHAPAVELAERLSRLCGGALGHAFYASDGASATEIALKMAFHFWHNRGREQKREFVALSGGYHGETVGALGVTDVPIFRDAYAPLLRAAHLVPSPDARLALPGEDAAAPARRAAAALEALLEEKHERIAALILEPLVQAASGMAMYDPEYLQLARSLCDRFELLLICDEIAVGCGRTGTFFAHEQAGIRPDLLCLSKGISGGYLPLSVVLASETVYSAFLDEATARAFLHSHSYTGNPLACRAALATLDLFRESDALAQNRARGDTLEALLEPVFSHPAVRHPRRCGMIFACDVDADPGFGRRFYRAALDRELLLRPLGNTLYAMPPYILSGAEMEFLSEGMRGALEAALAE
ncbi:MAG: adenosylmethionine--8-amino-7-oxononanoate transaminase [Betaproteobacteria bacterium]|nr:adenosylmethionine--8-amino-7-oxononanoate transaminase [Betaproteobacteria bacterium]